MARRAKGWVWMSTISSEGMREEEAYREIKARGGHHACEKDRVTMTRGTAPARRTG